MPARWKITRGGSWTWQYEEFGNGPTKILARATKSWGSKKEVRDEIEAMRRNKDIQEDED